MNDFITIDGRNIGSEYKPFVIAEMSANHNGDINNAYKIIDMAKSEGLRFNIGSLLESGVGRRACLHMASAYEISEECGLSTGGLFSSDICSFPDIIDGICTISHQIGIGEKDVTL